MAAMPLRILIFSSAHPQNPKYVCIAGLFSPVYKSHQHNKCLKERILLLSVTLISGGVIPFECVRQLPFHNFFFFGEREGCEMCNILLATLQFSPSIRGTQLWDLTHRLKGYRQKLPRIFYNLRKAKNCQMTVPFVNNFRSLSNKFPTVF